MDKKWCPRTDSNRGPIDYKSKSLLNFSFINVDTTYVLNSCLVALLKKTTKRLHLS